MLEMVQYATNLLFLDIIRYTKYEIENKTFYTKEQVNNRHQLKNSLINSEINTM